ncbi:MAG TPA: YdeI/OmpD-associated family protein [Cyclobacteriaceae bacterium]
MTPFKQREYAEYINDAAKQETKARRLEKIISMISKGIGLNDKYR